MKPETRRSIGDVLSLVAVAAAIVVIAKVLGVKGFVPGSVIEWACVAVACAQAR
jgi:hypothetical protein